MSTWTKDKNWADKYWPDIEQIIRRVAGRIITVSPTEADEDQAGRDYKVDCGGIAARIRRPNCQHRDVTIRSWRRSGAETELTKWIQGSTEWMIYGWTDEEAVREWVVLSIPELLNRGLHHNRREVRNPDRETGFIAIPVYEIMAKPRVLVDIELHNPTNVVKRGSLYPVVPCPRCGIRAYSAGPQGMPQRKCWACDWIWIPDIGETA